MNKELTLKDVLRAFTNWFNFLLTKWGIILFFGLTGAGLGLLYAFMAKPTYTASLNFILANTSGSSGGLMSIASQFGVDLSSSDNDVFNGDNIILLMESRRMVQQALLSKPKGSKLSLLNIYCENNLLDESWQKDDHLKNVYPFPDALSEWAPVQDSMFREIYKSVTDGNLTVDKPDKNVNIYDVVTVSHSEIFSYYLTKYIVDVTSSFYITTKTKVANNNLDMLQHEADSLRKLLGRAITTTAAQTDVTFNLNPAYSIQRSSSQQSQAQATVVGTAYGEVVKNLELAKITLQKETPLYQIVDEPMLPLVQERKSKLVWLIIGGFIGGLIIVAWLTLRRVFKRLKL